MPLLLARFPRPVPFAAHALPPSFPVSRPPEEASGFLSKKCLQDREGPQGSQVLCQLRNRWITPTVTPTFTL